MKITTFWNIHSTVIYSFYLYLLFFFSLTTYGQGQEGVCIGSLGENIFVNGDFGVGAANVIAINPQIAPGYNYTTNVPPGDGFYTITNNMGAWPSLYSSWLPIRDNSSDLNGYMMVVNADYNPGLFYEQNVTDLCPDTKYEFSADIINVVRSGVPNHILPNVDFALNGNVILSTGDIPQSNEWNHYSYSFSTGENETDLLLSLINNAPGGNGNDLALDNIRFRPCGPLATIVADDSVDYICLGEDNTTFTLQASVEDTNYSYFQWQVKPQNGGTWQDIEGANAATYLITNFSSGTFEYRYLLANTSENLQNSKCRLNSTIKEIVVLPIEYQVDKTICMGDGWEVGNAIYYSTGVYVDSLVSNIGCDSVITTNLTVLPDMPPINANVEITIPRCEGESNASIEVIEVINGTPPYTYRLDETEANLTGFFDFLPAGNHQLEIADRYGCNYLGIFHIEEPESLVVETNDDFVLAFGDSRTLSTLVTHTDVTFNWTPADGLSCTNCPTPTAKPFETTIYQVHVQNANGCTAIDSVRIEVDKNFRLGIPSAFSPNDDGINDFFEITTPFSTAIEELQQMKIFNRWGQVIYSTSEPFSTSVLTKWDGRKDFRLLDTGVYVYLLELKLIDGSIQTFSGTVTVVY